MPATITEVGNVTNVTGKARYHRDNNGWTTTYTYQGSLSEMERLEGSYTWHRWTTDLEQQDADVWQLTATANFNVRTGDNPQTEEPVVIWNMMYQTENKDLLNYDCPLINIIPDNAKKAITDALKADNEALLLNRLKLLQVTGDPYFATIYAYRHMQQGLRSLPVDVPVLQKTALADFEWQVNWSNSNINRVYSTNSLIAQENVDSRLRGIMPVENYQNSNNAYFITKQYGWRKGPVQTSQTSNNRFQIVQHWTYGLYPTMFVGDNL